MPPSRKQLGEMLSEARKAKGLTLRAAAEKLQMDFRYLGKIETGDYPLGKYAKPVAKLYGLNAQEIDAMAQTKLPNYRPYLRVKFEHLPDEALEELEEHFKAVTAKYKGVKR